VRRRLGHWVVVAALAGCNRYDLFVVQVGAQGGLTNEADVLFIIDDSDSMVEESVSMAENFTAFIGRLAAQERSRSTDGLVDAADAYVGEVIDPASYVDLNLALTTTDAMVAQGALIGEPLGSDEAATFVERLLCRATCFGDRQVAPSAPDYQCDPDDPVVDEVSREALDCLCGDDAWVGNCGTGNEMGLEAAYLAACRAVDDPPQGCFEGRAALTEADIGTAAGFLRPGASFIPVVVTDEGDNSPRMPTTEDLPQVYADLFAELPMYTSWAVVGPALDSNYEAVCPGATSWGVLRYEYMAQGTGGLTVDIHDQSCQPVDFGPALDRVGELIAGRGNAYPLEQRPVESTLVVQVDGRPVDPAEPAGQGLFGEPLYEDGWSYDAEQNVVRLHGGAQPMPGMEVRIAYLPKRAG